MRSILMALAFLVVVVPTATAASPEDVANDVSQEVMSPFCPGVTLHDCSSDAAIALRARIVKWARDGWDRDRILAALESEYGPGIRAVPERSGMGWLAWLLPAVALMAGAGIAMMVTRKWTAARADEVPLSDLSAADRARVDSELDALRGQL